MRLQRTRQPSSIAIHHHTDGKTTREAVAVLSRKRASQAYCIYGVEFLTENTATTAETTASRYASTLTQVLPPTSRASRRSHASCYLELRGQAGHQASYDVLQASLCVQLRQHRGQETFPQWTPVETRARRKLLMLRAREARIPVLV